MRRNIKIDARLVALGKAGHVADLAEHRAWRDLSALAEKLRRDRKLKVAPSVKFAGQVCHSRDTLLGLCRPLERNGPSITQGQRAVAELQARLDDQQRRQRKFSFEKINERQRRCRRDWQVTRNEIAHTPAQSVVGIAVKLRAVRRDIRTGETLFSYRILLSALKDAERLVRRRVRS